MDKKENKAVEETYTKEQILQSKRYKADADIVQAVLNSEKKYSLKEVDTAIEIFKKGTVM